MKLLRNSQSFQKITLEKEKQLKEVMKIMGLSNWLQWAAWFFESLIVLASAATLILITFKVHEI